MCGRFALFSAYPKFASRIGELRDDSPLEPRYNIAPGTWITTISRYGQGDQLSFGSMWWGYKPKWAGEEAPTPINATAEKIASSPYYKAAFQRHRCIVPADGWFEWIPGSQPKEPHFICREDREPIFFAAIFTERLDGAFGVAIITEPARGCLREVHHRMPLVLTDDCVEAWLDSSLQSLDTLRNAVRHIPTNTLTHWRVSTRVNKTSNSDDGSLIYPV